MEADPETGEVAFEYDGAEYRMVLDMRAIAYFERCADMSILDALDHFERCRVGGETPKLGIMAFVMQAGLRRHHPEVSPERALRMANTAAVRSALGFAIKAAAPPAEGGSAEGNGRAPTKRQTKPSGSTRSSKGRSKRG